ELSADPRCLRLCRQTTGTRDGSEGSRVSAFHLESRGPSDHRQERSLLAYSGGLHPPAAEEAGLNMVKHGMIHAFAALVLCSGVAGAQIRDPLKVQEGREKKLQARGSKAYYSEQWNLDDLPGYAPKQKVSGVIRQWGSNYFADSSLGKKWEEGFKKFHPEIAFEDQLKTALAGIPALTFGLADGAPMRHITSDETLLYQRYHNGWPLEITVVRGSLDVPGWSYAIGIFVHRDNPLSKLTVEQLDGIFGAQRSGAFQGTEWNTAV